MSDLNLTNLSTSLFWHKSEGETIPLYRAVGIKRIEDKEDGEALITFSVHPNGIEFITGMRQGATEIRYDAVPLDSPFAGRKFAELRDIRPVNVSVEEFSSLEMPAKEMFFIVEAKCFMTWHIFQEIDPEFSDDWRK